MIDDKRIVTGASIDSLPAEIATELLHSLISDDSTWWSKLDDILGRLESHGLCTSCALYVRKRNRATPYSCVAASPSAAPLRQHPIGPADNETLRALLSTPEGTHDCGEAHPPLDLVLEEPGRHCWAKRYPATLEPSSSPRFFAIATLGPEWPRRIASDRSAGEAALSHIFTSVFAAVRATLAASEREWLRNDRDDIAQYISHDVRGPLHGLDLAADSLGDLTDDNARHQRWILRTVGRLHRMFSNLVERLCLRFETDADQRDCALSVEPWRIVASLLEEFHDPELMAVTVPADLHPCPEHVVHAHTGYLELALHNVVDNARRHGRSDRPARAELCLIGVESDSVLSPRMRITVRDHGIGIPEDCRSEVFEYGYRTARSRRQNVSGGGVGLTIAKAIIEDHGGQIWVDPDVPAGAGTCIVIELPLSRRP